jgi:probable H4MPT-linked C1 transfer pathway protein
MTAELSDAFADRQRGVVSIAAIFAHEIAPDALFFAGARGFVEKPHVAANAGAIASANWRAPAELLARRVDAALLIDMGSTTTDLTLVRDGKVAAEGEDDASRIAAGELVYTGLLRGDPAMGVALAPVEGRWTGLVGERFASMADVRRLTGDLTPETDTLPNADGRSKSLEDTRARLARLVGRDAESATPQQWDVLAQFFARAQMRRVEDAIALIASREPAALSATVVGAGIGRGVIAKFSRREGRDYRAFDAFLPVKAATASTAADCAPACAVALLAGE